MAIPLCLPNNCQWNPVTGEYTKKKEPRSSLYVVDKALQKLRTVKGKRYSSHPWRMAHCFRTFICVGLINRGRIGTVGRVLDRKAGGRRLFPGPDQYAGY